jgi:hypothetical protein
VVLEFPEGYIAEIERLLYYKWYAASFVDDPRHSVAWATYGDGHKGVCLKFKASSHNPSIKLRRIVSVEGDHGVTRPVRGDAVHEFREVKYTGRFIETDFFRSMGRLTGPMLSFWFSNASGTVSPRVGDIFTDPAAWRNKHWSDFETVMTTKFPQWCHEKEFRLTLHSEVTDFSDKSTRLLEYNFQDLQGVIFGIRTPTAAKLKIMSIVERKCREHGRSDFEFDQAYYSPSTGTIETEKLPSVKIA